MCLFSLHNPIFFSNMNYSYINIVFVLILHHSSSTEAQTFQYNLKSMGIELNSNGRIWLFIVPSEENIYFKKLPPNKENQWLPHLTIHFEETITKFKSNPVSNFILSPYMKMLRCYYLSHMYQFIIIQVKTTNLDNNKMQVGIWHLQQNLLILGIYTHNNFKKLEFIFQKVWFYLPH